MKNKKIINTLKRSEIFYKLDNFQKLGKKIRGMENLKNIKFQNFQKPVNIQEQRYPQQL